MPTIADPGSHFGSPLYEFPFTETKVYIGFTALLINLVIVVVGTLVLRALKVSSRTQAVLAVGQMSQQPNGAPLAWRKSQ